MLFILVKMKKRLKKSSSVRNKDRASAVVKLDFQNDEYLVQWLKGRKQQKKQKDKPKRALQSENRFQRNSY